jgi:hypothetical protein
MLRLLTKYWWLLVPPSDCGTRSPASGGSPSAGRSACSSVRWMIAFFAILWGILLIVGGLNVLRLRRHATAAV